MCVCVGEKEPDRETGDYSIMQHCVLFCFFCTLLITEPLILFCRLMFKVLLENILLDSLALHLESRTGY